MKRNITVNIFGSLYPMDEDAYAMLNAYISNMRDYFSSQPDGKEIADDIEGRVAELMSELRQNGIQAISIEHIEEIINRVGKPEQLIEDESETTDTVVEPSTPSASKKKLFRDPEHKILGGVFAGLGCYFGVSPIWLRLTYLLILFLFIVNMPHTIPVILLLIAIYLVCWASIPLATNPGERLQMRGESVNLSSMCEEFLISTKELFSNETGINKDGRLTSKLINLTKWIFYGFGLLLMITCVVAFVIILLSIIGALSYPWNASREVFGDDFPILLIINSNPNWLIWGSIASFLIFITLSLYLAIHFVFTLLGRVRPLSLSLRTVCLSLWFISIVALTASASKVAGNTVRYHNYISHEKREQKEKAHSKEIQKGQLSEAGWEILKDKNIRHYTNGGEHFSGDRNRSYIDANIMHDGFGMEYEVERIQKVAPGAYRLKAKGRANGEGAVIFAIDGHGVRHSADIPVCGNKGGSVWKNACLTLEADTAKLLPNRHYLEQLSKANNSKGYGWSDIVINDIYVGRDSLIRYGVTNISDSKTWDGTWLSATSFEVTRQPQ